MTRYRSKNPAARARQDAVFRSMRGDLPSPNGLWRVVSRDLRPLTDGGEYAEARALADALGNGAMVLTTHYPLPPEERADSGQRYSGGGRG